VALLLIGGEDGMAWNFRDLQAKSSKWNSGAVYPDCLIFVAVKKAPVLA